MSTELNRIARSEPCSLRLKLALAAGVAILVAFAGLAGFLTGRGQINIGGWSFPGAPRAQAQRFLPFWEAWLLLERQFYSLKPLDPATMTYGAVTGMIRSLQDPYAGFSDPPEHRLENDNFAGEYGGIGVWLARDEQGTYIDSALPGSSAERAGLRSGDRLLAVEDQELGAEELLSSALLVRGPVPSTVRLLMERNGIEQSFDVPRMVIELPSVEWQLLSTWLGYIRIGQFTGRTSSEFAAALVGLRARGARALLLDLRDNGGGVPSASTKVLSQLVAGSIAYRELQANGDETRVVIPFAAAPPDPIPLAVLVNGGTASAAEIVAAAIQDHKRGPLVGTTTFGKGSVQGLFTLRDGSSIRITTSRWLTSLGKPIEGVGLQPELVGQTDEETISLAVGYLVDRVGGQAESLQLPRPDDNDGKVLV